VVVVMSVCGVFCMFFLFARGGGGEEFFCFVFVHYYEYHEYGVLWPMSMWVAHRPVGRDTYRYRATWNPERMKSESPARAEITDSTPVL